jgi:hypothetical protein
MKVSITTNSAEALKRRRKYEKCTTDEERRVT